METKIVDIQDLKLSPFNPIGRTKDVKELEESMSTNGFWPWCPVVVSRDMIVCDGHRRIRAAQNLGIQSVPVLVADGDADEIWYKFNALRKPIKPKDMAESVILGMRVPGDVRNTQAMKHINGIIKVGGKELLKEVLDNRASPNVYAIARQFIRYTDFEMSNDVISDVIRWMISKRCQRIVMDAIYRKLPPHALAKAFLENDPLTVRYTIE